MRSLRGILIVQKMLFTKAAPVLLEPLHLIEAKIDTILGINVNSLYEHLYAIFKISEDMIPPSMAS